MVHVLNGTTNLTGQTQNPNGKTKRKVKFVVKTTRMIKQTITPTHPGHILKEMYLEPLGLSQTEAASNLGVTRKTFSMLLNGHQGISAEMALRLAKAFNTTPELWLNLQRNYDLWNAEQKVKLSQIKVFQMPKTAARVAREKN
jgi:addiction module HigA family antidote